MNLLMITGDRALAAGKQGAFYNTLQELHKHFDRIDIICPRPRIQHLTFELRPFPNVFVYPSPWPLFMQWLWIRRKGRQIFGNSPFQLITCHEYAPFYNGFGARLLHRAIGVPYLLEIMHIPGFPRSSGFRETFYRWLTRRFIAFDARAAKAVRVINRHETPDFLVAAGVPREKLEYIPAFYIDLETFKPQEVPKQYDLLFVGRRALNKGYDLFLNVVQLTGLKALVIGDGHRFVKNATEVAELMNQSRLLLMTSLNEGGPRVVLEALACGVPVVATPVGIAPDVLPPECIEEWNAQDFAKKVQNLLADHQLYERVREAGLYTVKQFERTAAIKAYADALKKLMPSA